VVTQVSRSSLVRASADSVWRTLADFAAIGSWAPNVEHSSAASDPAAGAGAVRRVQVGRLALLERVTQWVPSERLAYRIEGLPPLAGDVETTWQIEPRPTGSQVTVTTAVDPMPRPPGPLVARIMARRLAAAAEEMLHGLSSHVERIQEHT
jgi:hypothetical protein